MPRLVLRSSLLVTLLYLCPRAAQGQTTPVAPPPDDAGAQRPTVDGEYGAYVDRALKEYASGNWAEAKVFFTRAHGLRPSARTLRGLGLTSYEMRSYVEACDYLRLALQSREKPLTDEMRKTVESALADAMSFVARYRVVLEPATATLEVDQAVPILRGEWLWLDPGAHQVSVQAVGFAAVSRTLTVQGGEQGELRVVLEPVAAPTAAPSPEPRPPASYPVELAAPPQPAPGEPPARAEHWDTQRVVGLGLGIGALVAAGVGTTSFVLAANEKRAIAGGCSELGCKPDAYRHNQAAISRAKLATIAFVTTGVLLAAGTLVYFTASSEEETARALRLQPELGLGNAGLTLTGRW